ncbi:MAG TPA: lipopolysaccharide biosynthesis protein [Blastocatellia bacterium]|nr:lipopolysaccharide biosynthesis protein [Blastocatellia bacterium]
MIGKQQITAESGTRLKPRGPALFAKLGETPLQTGMLFSAQMGATGIGFLIILVQLHWMDPAEMGRYALCISIILIGGLLIELGIYPAGARVLALSGDQSAERNALGALLLLTLADGALFSLFLVAIAIPAEWIFKQNVRSLLVTAAALVFFQPLQRMVEEGCQGLNRIRKLSAFRLQQAALQLVMLAALGVTHRLSARTAVIAYLASIGSIGCWTIATLRPRFHNSAQFLKLTLSELRGYGFNAYLANLTGTASTRLDTLIVSYYLGGAPVGLYFTAQKFSVPIATMSRALAVTRFRAFAKLKRVPARITRWNAAVLTVASVTLAVAGPILLKAFFPRYGSAAPLLVPFAAFSLAQGLFQPYNMFLASHGRGADLRNIAIVTTIAGVAALLLLVRHFGVLGAAWAGVFAMAVDYGLHLHYYGKHRRRIAEPNSVVCAPIAPIGS